MPSITDYRLTFIWTEVVLDALTGTLVPSAAAMPEAVSRPLYKAWFDAAQSTRPSVHEPAPPWPDNGRQRVWARYLQNADLLRVTGADAWRSVVPIRIPAPIGVDDPTPDLVVRTEGLVYPWGSVLIVSLIRTSPWSNFDLLSADIVDRRRGKHYSVDGGGTVTLDTVGAAGLGALRARVFGPAAGSPAPAEPFSIFTPVRGSGTPNELDPAQDSALHHALQAGASFSKTWQYDALAALEDGRVSRLKQQPPMHVVYGTRRGRSVWGPIAFLSPGERKLNCQHRNLVLVSAHVESLAAFARATMAEVPGVLGLEHQHLAKRAMTMLEPLYRASSTTHKTGSVKVQVDANGWLGDVNALRARLGWAPLS
jgi:hypothetical protein